MFCNTCGHQMRPDETACRACGARVLPGSEPPLTARGGRLRSFWNRVSEGQAVEQLWSELTSDARAGYRFYSREIDRESLQGRSRARRFFRYVGQLFWAIVTKLTPARRVVLLAGLVMLFWPAGELHFYGGLLILLVLILELADRITMKRDLEIAREIQLWLVPSAPPLLPGLDIAFATRPANTVAGDYYDVFPRTAGRTLIVIADVAGKSIPAALLMATFQASLRTLEANGCSLAELTAGLNRYLSAHSRGGLRFTTAFLGEFDSGSGYLSYINAGHNAPVLLRTAAPPVERLEAGGVPLGIYPDAGYECGRVAFSPGDLLLLFTDGVVEAVNAREEEYGEPRLLAFLQANRGGGAMEVVHRLMQQVETFVAGAPQHDDMTCVVLRRG